MSDKMVVPTLSRPYVKFTVPEAARQFETDPKEVVFRPLTVRQEIEANKIARITDAPDAALPFELMRQGTDSVDGKKIDWGTTDPQWIEGTSPKCRELLLRGWLRVNRLGESQEDKQAQADFFESMKVSTG